MVEEEDQGAAFRGPGNVEAKGRLVGARLAFLVMLSILYGFGVYQRLPSRRRKEKIA